MKKTLFLTLAMLVSSSAFATTEHYVLRDGNLVQHLKVTDVKGDITVSADIDFEPSETKKDLHACSVSLSSDAKRIDKDNIIVKKHSEVDTSVCELKIHLTDTGAKIERSEDCDNFATGMCRFSNDGKELIKVK